MNKTECILRKNTMNLFSDDWYFKTSEELLNTENSENGYVYFVKNGIDSLVKIGKAMNASSRIKSYITSFGKSVYVCGFIYIDNYSSLEKKIHLEFGENRIKGEWFDLNVDQIEGCLKNYNGTIVNSFFDKKSNIIDGIPFGFKRNEVLDFYDEFFKYCETLILNERYDKFLFNDNIRKIKKYSNITPKRSNLILKKWASNKGLLYKDGNSNGIRHFYIK